MVLSVLDLKSGRLGRLSGELDPLAPVTVIIGCSGRFIPRNLEQEFHYNWQILLICRLGSVWRRGGGGGGRSPAVLCCHDAICNVCCRE
jgi:hypothetical protein